MKNTPESITVSKQSLVTYRQHATACTATICKVLSRICIGIHAKSLKNRIENQN
jgi:hypothetical protein